MFLRHKILYLTIGAIGAVLSVEFFSFNHEKSDIPKVKAAQANNVRGFAWSSNIGWISFNSLNCDMNDDEFIDTNAPIACPLPAGSPMRRYGVNLEASNVLSGFAWSSNIGWINFNWPEIKDISGNQCPGGNGAAICRAKLNGTDFYGWARACSVFSSGCSGALKPPIERGDWDGWIRLRKDPADAGADYGVSLSGYDFTGFAWDSEVMGWIVFNSKNCDVDNNSLVDAGACGGDNATTSSVNYKVYLAGGNPTLTIFAQSLIDYCTEDLPNAISLKWEFNDAEDGYNNQTAYEIVLDKFDSSWNYVGNCSPPKQGSALSPDNTRIFSGVDINNFCPGFISYGGFNYKWKLKVFDSDNNENIGGYMNGEDFPKNGPTPKHAYPKPEFTYVPNAGLMQYINITFNPSTSIIDPGVYVSELEWTWGDGNDDSINIPLSPGVDLGQTKVHAYATVGNKTVDLRIKDSDDYECSIQKVVSIVSNKPIWDETIP